MKAEAEIISAAFACRATYALGNHVAGAALTGRRVLRHHAQPSRWGPFSIAATLLLLGIAPLCAAEPPSSVKSFVAANCVDCHDESSEKGGFDITKLPFDLANPNAFSRWVHVLDRVEAGEMPPKEE